MIITKKITTVGNSSGILLDKAILKKMKLKRGDFVEIRIKKVNNGVKKHGSKNRQKLLH